jgi:haloacetate dehalogenase
MFGGFELDHADLGDVTLRYRSGGAGPPVVLLYGVVRRGDLTAKNRVVCTSFRSSRAAPILRT